MTSTTAEGTAVILSANPIHDTGGGQRSAQLALELLERGWAVVFVSHGVVTETVDLELRYDQAGLVQLTLKEALEPERRRGLLAALSETRGLVITQVPVHEWVPLISEAAELGVATVYDCIDRWASELGRGWYRRSVEADVARASGALMASAPVLVDHVEELTGRRTELLPNAYNARVFDARRRAQLDRPESFPDDGRVALYVGALWGGWMDWALVRAVAESLPDTTFVFVGDHRGEGRGLPANCVFTGLLPQSELPRFLAYADVAFLPWRVDDVTVATSPLKVYEFVAMELPVVAPDIEPLRGIPGVRTERGAEPFARALGAAGREGLAADELRAMRNFAQENSWTRRVERLLEVADLSVASRHTLKGSRRGSEVATHGGVPVSRQAPVSGRRACISVVMPAYNHERFVARALESVERQSLPPGEIVVVDDGSTDQTARLVANRSVRGLRLIRQENRGAHNALNRAIRLSRGDWLAVLNSDDAWETERLEHAWAVCRETGAALVVGAVRLVDEDGGSVDPTNEIAQWYGKARSWASEAGSLRSVLARHNIGVTTSNFFFHRSLWTRLGGFRDYRYVHDYDLLLRAVEMCPGRVVYEPELDGVLYRVHPANTITEGGAAQRERRALMTSLRRPMGRVHRIASGLMVRRKLGRVVEASSILEPVPVVAPPFPGGGRARVLDPQLEADPQLGLGSRVGSRPRVGLVVESLDFGGLEEVVALLAQALPAVGVEASVACVDSGGAVARRLAEAGVDVTVLGGRRERVVRWAEERAVVAANSHFAPVEAVQALAGAGIPVVETVQNCYAWLEDDGWSRERQRAEALTGVIAVSEIVASYYGSRTGRAAEWTVPNAVHPARAAAAPRAFARGALGLPTGVPVLAFVGRITEQKNPRGLLDAFQAAGESVGDAILVLAGPADGSVSMAALRRRHAGLFRRGRIRHLSSPRHMGTVLSSADGYVSNAFYEGWSVAASEAAWVGLPLILSETGGSRELVGPDGERGEVVPNPCGDALDVNPDTVGAPADAARRRNVDALAAAITRCVGEIEGWRTREPAIRRWARGEVAPDVIARRYADILLEVGRG